MIDEETLNKLIEEYEMLKRQNENLLRIMREKSNQDRELRPKSKHTGYVVLFSKARSSDLIYNGQNLTRWETVMQTPYTVEIDFADVQKIIDNDFLSTTDSIRLKLGISQYKPLKYENLNLLDKTKENILFKYELCANFRSGYWEITLSHTLPITVPAELKYNKK